MVYDRFKVDGKYHILNFYILKEVGSKGALNLRYIHSDGCLPNICYGFGNLKKVPFVRALLHFAGK